jgi:hypothetical protein
VLRTLAHTMMHQLTVPAFVALLLLLLLLLQ